MDPILRKLQGGDRRSKGRSEEVCAEITAHPGLFPELLKGMWEDDPIVRMRSADAVEKITAAHPEYLAPHKSALLQLAAVTDQQEVRWHLAPMLTRLDLTDDERAMSFEILLRYLVDRSAIVRTFAMQALADTAKKSPEYRPRVVPLLRRLTETGTAAMKSRGRKLLAELDPLLTKA